MSSKPKLHYFNSRGRAETCRLILAYADVSYEDVRYTGETWAEFKPKTPLGSMPVWEEDGKMMGGSLVIARYLGEKYGLAGDDAWEKAQVANIVDFINDLTNELMKVAFETAEAEKAEAEKKMIGEIMPKYLGKLESLAGENGYLWGKKMTWADLCLYTLLDYVADKLPWDNFPNVKKMRSNVEANENIAKWLKERPKTER